MLIFFPLAVLLVAVLLILGLPRFRPAFSSEWLLSVAAMLTSAAVVVIAHSQFPMTLTPSSWDSVSFIHTPLLLLLDQTSWAFALSILVLGISCFFLPVKQSPEVRSEIIFTLWLVLIVLFSVFSGNLLTVALMWVVFDILVFVFHILLGDPSFHTKAINYRLISSLLLAFAFVLTSTNEHGFSHASMLTYPTNLITFSAVILRLAAGFHYHTSENARTEKTYLAHLQPILNAAMALLVAVRSADIGMVVNHGVLFGGSILFISLILIIKSFQQVGKDSHIPYWYSLAPGLIILSTSQSQGNSALFWGIAFLFISWFQLHSNPSNSLSKTASILLLAILLFGNANLIDVPSGNSSWFSTIIQFGFLLVHGLFILDFLRKVFLPSERTLSNARRGGLSYSIGILVPPLTLLGIVFSILWPFSPPANLLSWSPIYLIGLTIIFLIISRIKIRIPMIFTSIFDSLFSFRWLSGISSWMIRTLTSFTNTITLLLEGEGGVLWALLLVALLVSLITQLPIGS